MLVHDMKEKDFPRCCACHEIIKSNVASLNRGFIYHACSVKCAANRAGRTEQIKSTKLKRHGNANYNNGNAISQTLKNKTVSERKEISDKCKATKAKHAQEDPLYREKITAKGKATKEQKYGDSNYNNAEQIS